MIPFALVGYMRRPRLEEPFMDSGGADVGREFSSGFEDGERRKMDVEKTLKYS